VQEKKEKRSSVAVAIFHQISADNIRKGTKNLASVLSLISRFSQISDLKLKSNLLKCKNLLKQLASQSVPHGKKDDQIESSPDLKRTLCFKKCEKLKKNFKIYLYSVLFLFVLNHFLRDNKIKSVFLRASRCFQETILSLNDETSNERWTQE
jgi:hypothetical protein